MTLEQLVSQTRTDSPSAEPLDLLTTAARQQQELSALGDELLNYWVQHARAAGCSWTQVGGALGVSKQAAQQRHSVLHTMLDAIAKPGRRKGLFTRFTPPAREVVVLGREEARKLGHSRLGTEHLLLGLLVEREGVAAQVLDAAGITAEGTRSAVREVAGCGRSEPRGHIPFTPRAKKVMELALREAIHLKHNHIGTEHILLGLIREGEGLATRVLTDHGLQLRQLHDAVVEQLDRS